MGQIACQGVGDQAPLAVREYLLQQEENAMRLRISSVLAFSLVSLFLLVVLFLAVILALRPLAYQRHPGRQVSVVWVLQEEWGAG
jgi:flagellar biogenesis protein FliO